MHAIAWWPTVVTLLVATITDLRSRKIPNWLVFPFMAGGFLVMTCLHGWAGAARSFSGLVLGLSVCSALAFLRALGMGDVKLCAAIGAWIGPTQLITALIFTGLAGGLIALGWAISAGFWREMVRNSRILLSHFCTSGIKPHAELSLNNPRARKMPYAPAIAIGTLLSFLAG
jgi:prepilin peptidase CpaA